MSRVKGYSLHDLSECTDLLIVRREEQEKTPSLKLRTRMVKWGCDHSELLKNRGGGVSWKEVEGVLNSFWSIMN